MIRLQKVCEWLSIFRDVVPGLGEEQGDGQTRWAEAEEEGWDGIRRRRARWGGGGEGAKGPCIVQKLLKICIISEKSAPAPFGIAKKKIPHLNLWTQKT